MYKFINNFLWYVELNYLFDNINSNNTFYESIFSNFEKYLL